MSIPTASRRVDAHQHFWRYSDAEFGWIDDSMAAIRRDFLPDDLKPSLIQTGVHGTVAVQARQSLEETEWLLSLAKRHPWIEGVVGWVPLHDPKLEETLAELSADGLKGVRHVLQGEEDAYMDRDDFNRGVALLRNHGLTYDLLVFERQLPAAIRFVDRHPDQPFALDHLAKPQIAVKKIEPWRTNINELARQAHVCCKISGMVTEADLKHWSEADLRPYFDIALNAFGPARLLFGSDWPVCTVNASYSQWSALVRHWVNELSQDEQNQILGANAINFYGLQPQSQSSEVH